VVAHCRDEETVAVVALADIASACDGQSDRRVAVAASGLWLHCDSLPSRADGETSIARTYDTMSGPWMGEREREREKERERQRQREREREGGGGDCLS
jgi:hypothetical protein